MTARRALRARLACVLVGVVAVAAGCGSTASTTPSAPSFVPMPDPASMQQVIEPAREFVVLNRLQNVSATYGWVACRRENDALFYGEVRLSFRLPAGIPEDRYLAGIVKMMVSHGWADSPLPGDRPVGIVLHTNEVRAAITGGDANDREDGMVRLSGECRNTGDHRNANVDIDVTDQLLG